MDKNSRLFLLALLSLGISATASAEELLFCEQVLDFETDADGAPIVAGQDLAEVYAGYGVHLQTFNSAAMTDGRGVAFDSSNPADHDLDLGTPNEYYGGPGVSSDGSGGSNGDALGNLLISAENFTDADGDGILDDPDDDAAGAWFDWHFDTPVCVTGLDLVDIESSEGPADLIFYDASGDTIDWVQAGGMGDNSVEHVGLLVCGVSSALFDLYGSGAVDNVSYCLPTETCVIPAVPDPLYSGSTITHSLWLPGVATDLVFEPDPASFLEFIDGTAQITGTAYSASNTAAGFEVEIQLTGMTTTPSADGPKMGLYSGAYVPYGPVDTSTWYYYADFYGTLTGVGDYAGASIEITPRGPYFQVGEGANDKNTNYGASGWFYYDVLSQPDTGAFTSHGSGDINVDLVDCDAGGEEEVCDDLDNDGDGLVDEGFESDSDGDGVYDCLDTEDCDGVDNDGDGLVDEGLPDADMDGLCDGLDDEVCDLNDNDGDGHIDEGLPDSDGDGLCDGLDLEECDGVDNDGDYSIDEGFDIDGDGLADCYDAEECDGVDNDGDGLTDEGFDSDGDGVADCFDGEECDELDNDGDGAIDEGFDSDADGIADCFDTEECDGVDNDGDMIVDEDQLDTDGDGICDGIDVELCDGLDNDGDGTVDEGLDSDYDGVPDCEDVEECDGVDNDGDLTVDEGFDADADGTADCFDTEVCDGLDNDGDGTVDEGSGDSDMDGVLDCFDSEDCDGIDNDGDGQIDEHLPDGDGDGICDGLDTEECDGIDNDGDGAVDEGFDSDGDGLASCFDPEECDGLDNDGDGLTDEGFDADGDGVADCFDGEDCDGVDNDGDGTVDEGLDSDWDGIADCFDTEECDFLDNDGDGLIDEGLPDSDMDGVCDGQDHEVCDELDNDGDGLVDEGYDSDGDGVSDCFDVEECDGVDNNGNGVIDEGYDWDGDGIANCFDTEECDGLDNDGDGYVDEDTPDADGDGTPDCSDTETCDGIDNDGDGSTDEGFDVDGDAVPDCFDQEECDGVDNNGDGQIDEGFDVDTDGVADCYDSEECDLRDNDGDGQVDEGLADCDTCPDPVVVSIGYASEYNVVSFGDYTGGLDVAGKVAVDGDAWFSNFSVGASTTGGDVLIASGALDLSFGTVHGNAVYGTTYAEDTVGYNFGGAPRMDTPVDFAAMEAEAIAASTSLQTLTVNGTTILQDWGDIEMTGTNAALNVFELTCDDLALAPSLFIDAPADSTAVVNVSGASCSIEGLYISLTGVDRSDVLFNLYEATELSIENVSMQGSVLAPYAATVFNNGNFQGTLITAELAGDGEFHDYPFDGQIVECPEPEGEAGTCTYSYTETSAWEDGGGEGFQAEVDFTWYGGPVDGWTLEWDFAGDESISSGWNGVFSQTDAHVTVTDDGWNAVLDEGTAASVGFTASRTTAAADPTGLMVNGVVCTEVVADEGGDTGDTGGFE